GFIHPGPCRYTDIFHPCRSQASNEFFGVLGKRGYQPSTPTGTPPHFFAIGQLTGRADATRTTPAIKRLIAKARRLKLEVGWDRNILVAMCSARSHLQHRTRITLGDGGALRGLR